MFNLRLRNFPLPHKALAIGYLAALGVAYMYAVFNIALVVGMTPDEIAIHDDGAAERVVIEAAPEGEEEFSLDDVKEETSFHQPSLKNLVAEGHFHLFGMTSFFFGLTLLGLFTSVPDKWKAALVGIPYIVVIADNLSFMATRFLGPKFAFLTAGAGALMGLCFLALWVLVFIEIVSKPTHPETAT